MISIASYRLVSWARGEVDLDVDLVVDLDGDGNVEESETAGEAMECAASLDVMRLRKLINDARYARGIQLLEGVVAMMTKMIRAARERQRQSGKVHVAVAVNVHG